ncbi:hypothetical protein [Mesobacillus maritimus]|uniref:Uncharacterized protein n=1 Tax=Mesobacillus maritimus TaxID=1643336 RepID=A0ABS7K165_9BACI|nr:hypothetical protein [Mesobacillus maritimus]MBY0095992.1 hypothetical protein [Mesobacillus maritimus]
MITLSSITNLQEASQTLEKIKKEAPALHEKLLHAVQLTRALQFKYHYLGCSLLELECKEENPTFVSTSVLNMYKKELSALTKDPQFFLVKQLFSNYQRIGYAKICLLILDRTPNSLVGPTSIK